jgi:hypothetical protein
MDDDNGSKSDEVDQDGFISNSNEQAPFGDGKLTSNLKDPPPFQMSFVFKARNADDDNDSKSVEVGQDEFNLNANKQVPFGNGDLQAEIFLAPSNISVVLNAHNVDDESPMRLTKMMTTGNQISKYHQVLAN